MGSWEDVFLKRYMENIIRPARIIEIEMWKGDNNNQPLNSATVFRYLNEVIRPWKLLDWVDEMDLLDVKNGHELLCWPMSHFDALNC